MEPNIIENDYHPPPFHNIEKVEGEYPFPHQLLYAFDDMDGEEYKKRMVFPSHSCWVWWFKEFLHLKHDCLDQLNEAQKNMSYEEWITGLQLFWDKAQEFKNTFGEEYMPRDLRTSIDDAATWGLCPPTTWKPKVGLLEEPIEHLRAGLIQPYVFLAQYGSGPDDHCPHQLMKVKKYVPMLQRPISQFLQPAPTSPQRNSVAATLTEPQIKSQKERFNAILEQVKVHGRFNHYEHVVQMQNGHLPMDHDDY